MKETIFVSKIKDRVVVTKYYEGKHSRSSNSINLTEEQVEILIRKLVAI